MWSNYDPFRSHRNLFGRNILSFMDLRFHEIFINKSYHKCTYSNLQGRRSMKNTRPLDVSTKKKEVKKLIIGK